jgi:hypothetical protein
MSRIALSRNIVLYVSAPDRERAREIAHAELRGIIGEHQYLSRMRKEPVEEEWSARFRLKNEHAQQFEDCMAREEAELELEIA